MDDPQLYLAITAIGTVVLLIGLYSGAIQRSPISEPMLALGLGIILGPAITGLLTPEQWGETERLLRETARLTLAIGLMGVALRLPSGFFRQHWRSLAMMLGPVMVLMWLVSGALCWLFLGGGIWMAMLIGACLTPTDPILASSIVSGGFARQNLPAALRHTISGESGANDGLGLLLVMLPVLMMGKPADTAIIEWLTRTLLWEVLFAVVMGLLIGVAAGRLLHRAERRKTIAPTSLLSYSLALSLVVLGASQLLGSDGILAVFVAGRGFAAVTTVHERNEEERVQEAVNQFFVLPVFVLFGMLLPWNQWAELGWAGVALVAAVLLLRRVPALLVLHRWIGTLRPVSSGLFAGWFGPIGIAALFYAAHSSDRVGDQVIWHVTSLVVFGSILVHGVTATPAIRWYARHVKRHNIHAEAR